MPVPGMGPAAPPMPPGIAGNAAPQPQMPSMMQLSGMGGPQQGPMPGTSQISESAVRMAAEIDQAMKLLAQAIPTLAPWVEQVVAELRYQVGTALQSGAVPTSPVPQDNQNFPDGGGRV